MAHTSDETCHHCHAEHEARDAGALRDPVCGMSVDADAPERLSARRRRRARPSMEAGRRRAPGFVFTRARVVVDA